MNMLARESMSSQTRLTMASSPGMAGISLRCSLPGLAQPARRRRGLCKNAGDGPGGARRAPGRRRRRPRMPRGIHAVFPREIGHRADVLHAGVVLDDGAGVHDVAAVAGHAVDDLLAVLADLLGRARAEQVVGNAAAEAELLAQHAMGLDDVALVDVIDDAAGGQLGERFEVMVPLALGVEERLAAVGPKLLDDRLDGGPVDVLERSPAKRRGRRRGASSSRWAPGGPDRRSCGRRGTGAASGPRRPPPPCRGVRTGPRPARGIREACRRGCPSGP